MKIFRFILLLMFVMFALGITAQTRDGEARLNIHHVVHHGTHSEYYPPADMPEVYLDLDDMEIIIEADGFADYYVVNIISQVTMQSVIYTQISGYGDSVDVSSLPDGYYRLVITSSNSNVFEGYFMIKNNSRLPLSRIR